MASFIIESQVNDEWVEVPTLEDLCTFEQAGRAIKLAHWEATGPVRLTWLADS